VVYAGAPLLPETRYFWKVRTWDKDGAASPYSGAGTFGVGLNTNADWSGAAWIKRDTNVADDYTFFRKSVVVPERTVARATAYISSVHKYALYLNGALQLKGPAYHYPQFQYYNAVDVTSAIVPGATNVFAIFNHWFGGGQGRATSARGVLMKAVIHYTDGTSSVIGTDGTWKQTQATAWITGQPQRGGEGVGYIERIDARNLLPDWNSVAFNDAAWANATVIGGQPTAPWTGTLNPDLTRIEESVRAPLTITDKGAGKYVIDLGKVYAGVPRISFTGGASGDVVNMRGGYVLNAAGEIDPTKNQSTNLSFFAVLSGAAFTYEPAEYFGMRYFQIDNAPMPVTSANFQFIERHSRLEENRSTFASSNSTLNRVWELMKHSLTVCAQEEFVDTPTREKGGFLGDAFIQSSAAMSVHGERVLSRQALHEFLQSMTQFWSTPGNTGRMNAVYPNSDNGRDIPDYTQCYLPWVWEYYQQTGDKAFLAANYPQFKSIGEYVHRSRNASTGLITDLVGGSGAYQFGIIDWPASMRFGYDMTAARTVINCWAWLDYDLLARIAGELGQTADRDLFRTRADELQTAINSRLLHSSGVYVDGLNASAVQSAHISQQANAFPLALGLVPAAQRASVVAKVKELRMSSGMITLPWLVQSIGEAGEGEHLIELFTNPEWLGWARSLALGATVTWESWNSDTDGTSQSHGWGAAGLNGYVRYILGVKPLKPQFEEVQIRPLDFGTKLTSVRGKVPTERGDLAVSWDRTPARFQLEVTIPVNVTATIQVPRGLLAGDALKVDGVAVVGTPAGDYLSISGIGSGTHRVERVFGPTAE
jgi:alpha-L-rhamnosidase